jgi:hypothetical protein
VLVDDENDVAKRKRVAGPQVQVFRVRLSVRESQAILIATRRSCVSVQAVLVAALVLAGKQLRESWQSGDMRCRAPVHLRGRLLKDEIQPEAVLECYANGPLAHELMITNYGRSNLRTHFGALALTALSSTSASGGPSTQKVSAFSLNDRLMLALASPDPIRGRGSAPALCLQMPVFS